MDAPEFQLAAVFDHVDPVTGPGFADDHPVVADPDTLALLLRRLRAGAPVLVTPLLMDDSLNPERKAEVPMNFRTDGRWIWTDTVTYYLAEYGVAPEPGLLAHLSRPADEADEADAAVDQETVERAVAFVLDPAQAGEPVHVLG
ncbi:hypothetical protein [Streptomyces sp. NPDC090025]|uniref:hypothetical protein n=1 Tax=Streptomyces sp. NPDC090025 TaxID=3365922 RepID=UPI00383407C3